MGCPVSKVATYRLNHWGEGGSWASSSGRNSFFVTRSTQPHIQWIQAFFLGVKAVGVWKLQLISIHYSGLALLSQLQNEVFRIKCKLTFIFTYIIIWSPSWWRPLKRWYAWVPQVVYSIQLFQLKCMYVCISHLYECFTPLPSHPLGLITLTVYYEEYKLCSSSLCNCLLFLFGPNLKYMQSYWSYFSAAHVTRYEQLTADTQCQDTLYLQTT